MNVRPIVATIVSGLLFLGVVSASSLGDVASPVLEAAVVERSPCIPGTVSYATPAGPVDLTALPVPALVTTVTGIDLVGLEGDCAGLRPVVTVIGRATGSGDTLSVLSTEMFGALSALRDQRIALDASHDLSNVFTLLVDVHEIRIAFVES